MHIAVFILLLIIVGLLCLLLFWLAERLHRRHYWRNKKNGELYVVLGTVLNCTNDQDGQVLVEYTKLYSGNGQVFARKRGEFFEKFERVYPRV